MSVLVVGSIALDTLRMPDGKVYRDVPGGSCTYFIHSAYFFAPVRVVGVVGGDFPKKCLREFERRGVDLAGLQVLPGKTFQWHGTYMKNLNERKTDALHFGVLETFNPVLPKKYLDSKFLFLACAQPELQMRVLDQVKGKPLAVCDTIEVYINNSRKALEKLIRRCQGMIVNDAEARLISGEDNLVAAAAGMLKKFRLEFVALKKGEHGALLATREGILPIPAYPLVRVVDPTGAGDCFAGGFMGTLARLGRTDMKSLKTAAVNATTVASYCCQGVALSGLDKLALAQVRERAAKFAGMTRLG